MWFCFLCPPFPVLHNPSLLSRIQNKHKHTSLNAITCYSNNTSRTATQVSSSFIQSPQYPLERETSSFSLLSPISQVFNVYNVVMNLIAPAWWCTGWTTAAPSHGMASRGSVAQSVKWSLHYKQPTTHNVPGVLSTCSNGMDGNSAAASVSRRGRCL